MIGVLIADDQALVRRGFGLILEIEPDMEVVGEVPDGVAAVAACRELHPDVVLMDVRMPGLDGIAATEQITRDPDCGETKVVMLTTFDMDEYVYEALQAGASGFLLKDVQPELLVSGIRAVHAGDSLLAPSVTRRMISAFLETPGRTRRPRTELSQLTARERETLELLARGMSNAEIAAELFVSETTVKTHVGRVLTKLGLRDRVQAVIFAYENGLVAERG
jgi:DNA-binding NarL/FixJ family response regulator